MNTPWSITTIAWFLAAGLALPAAEPQPLITLKGHDAPVLCVSFLPGDTLLASGSDDGTIRLWEVATGKQRAVVKAHRGAVTAITCSPDGKILASAGTDEAIKLWDVATSKLRAALRQPASLAGSLRFTVDGDRLVSVDCTGWRSGGGKLIVWNVETDNEGVAFWKKLPPEPWLHHAWSQDGKLVGIGGRDEPEIQVWAAPTGSPWITLAALPGKLDCLAFSPDGKTLAVAGYLEKSEFGPVWAKPSMRVGGSLGKKVSVAFYRIAWLDLATRRETAWVPAEGGASVLAFDPHGKFLFAGGCDGSLTFWDFACRQQRLSFAGHAEGFSRSIRAVAFSHNGKVLASAGDDRAIKLWDMEKLQADQPEP